MPEIPTHQSFSGFIATDPVLKHTSRGQPRLYFVAGKEHWNRDEFGELVKHDTTFHHLALYGTSADKTYDQLAKGDWIIAEGKVRTYTRRDGTSESEFTARRIGHDLNHTSDTSDRATRNPAMALQADDTPAPERNGPATVATPAAEAEADPDAVAQPAPPAASSRSGAATSRPVHAATYSAAAHQAPPPGHKTSGAPASPEL